MFSAGLVFEVLRADPEWAWTQAGLRIVYMEKVSNHYDGYEARRFQRAAASESEARTPCLPDDLVSLDWRWMEPEPDWSGLIRQVAARPTERLRPRLARGPAKPLPLP